MTALRFQTGGRHQTSPASLRGHVKVNPQGPRQDETKPQARTWPAVLDAPQSTTNTYKSKQPVTSISHCWHFTYLQLPRSILWRVRQNMFKNVCLKRSWSEHSVSNDKYIFHSLLRCTITSFGAYMYLYSVGFQQRNLHQSLPTMNGVTYFIPRPTSENALVTSNTFLKKLVAWIGNVKAVVLAF